MKALRVMPPMRIAFVGSPSYFARNPAPKSPEDLAKHNCIQMRLPVSGTVLNWSFTKKRVSRDLPLTFHSVAARASAVDTPSGAG